MDHSNEVVKKVCCRCGKEKPLSDYYRKHTSRDGLTAACKSCLGLMGVGRGNKVGGVHPWRVPFMPKQREDWYRRREEEGEAA